MKLLNSVDNRSHANITEIINKYKVPLVKYFYWNIHNYEDSLDLFQDTSMKIYMNYNNFRHECSLNTWIYKIAKNCMIEYIRSKSRRNKNVVSENIQTFFVIDNKTDIELDYIRNETTNHIWKEVNKLSFKLKQVFILKEMFGFKCNEISEILTIPVGTVLSRLFKAQKTILKQIKDTEI